MKNGLPSFIIILLISYVLREFQEIVAVQYAFAGIRACVVVLIFNAVCKLFKKAVIDKKTALIYALVLLGAVFLPLTVCERSTWSAKLSPAIRFPSLQSMLSTGERF